jgi:LAO/AO transport system kinase
LFNLEPLDYKKNMSDSEHIRYKHTRTKLPEATSIANEIIKGNLTMLSQAITLLESSLASHKKLAQQILEYCLPYSGKSIRIGITGVPGVGKSTFINSFGKYIISQNKKVAVLAIDPSSQRTGGSILGDKTRMFDLSTDINAFIRPSPSSGALGGVANATRESIILCEAAGYDVIIVETVGVGQSEIAVQSMVDFFLLLMLAGAGDELQGIKRGIMEMADAISINKADGNNLNNAQKARAEYAGALQLFPLSESGWKPVVETCSAVENKGIDKIWNIILSYQNQTKLNGYFEQKRNEQAVYWMHECIDEQIKSFIQQNEALSSQIKKLENAVKSNTITPYNAALKIIKTLKKEL